MNKIYILNHFVPRRRVYFQILYWNRLIVTKTITQTDGFRIKICIR